MLLGWCSTKKAHVMSPLSELPRSYGAFLLSSARLGYSSMLPLLKCGLYSVPCSRRIAVSWRRTPISVRSSGCRTSRRCASGPNKFGTILSIMQTPVRCYWMPTQGGARRHRAFRLGVDPDRPSETFHSGRWSESVECSGPFAVPVPTRWMSAVGRRDKNQGRRQDGCVHARSERWASMIFRMPLAILVSLVASTWQRH